MHIKTPYFNSARTDLYNVLEECRTVKWILPRQSGDEGQFIDGWNIRFMSTECFGFTGKEQRAFHMGSNERFDAKRVACK